MPPQRNTIRLNNYRVYRLRRDTFRPEIKNETKRPMISVLLVSFLALNAAFGRHRHCLKPKGSSWILFYLYCLLLISASICRRSSWTRKTKPNGHFSKAVCLIWDFQISENLRFWNISKSEILRFLKSEIFRFLKIWDFQISENLRFWNFWKSEILKFLKIWDFEIFQNWDFQISQSLRFSDFSKSEIFRFLKIWVLRFLKSEIDFEISENLRFWDF